MPNDAAPFRFLDLSYDIREQIYTMILTYTAPRDVVISHDLNTRSPLPPPASFDTTIYTPLTPTSIKSSSLLLTNHQIHAELVSIIKSLTQNSTTADTMKYILDLSMTHKLVLPTWISLPTPPRYVSRVHVYLHLLSKQEMDEDGNEYRWWAAGGPAPISQGMLQLLADFLVYGPTFRPVPDSSNTDPTHSRRRVLLDNLTLEFIRSNPENPEPSPLESVSESDLELGSEQYNCFRVMLLLQRVVDSGQLVGRVKTVKFVAGDEVKEWMVDEHAVPRDKMLKTAKEWSAYGWRSLSDALEREF